MDILNNIEWFIGSQPKTAINKFTKKNITQKEFDTIVFDNSIKGSIKFSLPLNNNLLFFETRKLLRPINVKQILNLIYKFYKEPIKNENIDKAFEEMEEWKEDVLFYYKDDISQLKKYDVFTDTCTPDFCGLEFNSESEEYIVLIGPE